VGVYDVCKMLPIAFALSFALYLVGGGSSTEAHKMLKRAIGDNAMGRT